MAVVHWNPFLQILLAVPFRDPSTMKPLTVGIAVAALLTIGEFAHGAARPFTRPNLPSNADLNRVHLQLAWRNRVAMAGARDAISTAQVLGTQLLVQTRTGLIALLNGENGQILWQVRSRVPFDGQHALGHNYNTIFGYNQTFAFGLDRATGELKYIFELSNLPSASPVADAERLYVCLIGGRMLVYDLTNPIPRRDERGAPGENLFVPREEEPKERDYGPNRPNTHPAASPLNSRRQSLVSIGPLTTAVQASRGNEERFTLPMLWQYRVDRRLEQTPVVTPRNRHDPGYVLLGSTDGAFTIGSKLGTEIVFNWKAGSAPVAPLNRHDHEAYIGLEDGSVIAMTMRLLRDLEPGKVLWRTGTGAAIEHRLNVTDNHVYALPKHRGLLRFQRQDGELLWRAPEAERFLSASKRFVYALDRRGYLLVLNQATGNPLSRLDVRDFPVSVDNDHTDRIYLAAHDGQIICLRDRAHPKPLWNKQFVEDQPVHPRGKKPEDKEMGQPKKEMEKKEMEKKEEKE